MGTSTKLMDMFDTLPARMLHNGLTRKCTVAIRWIDCEGKSNGYPCAEPRGMETDLIQAVDTPSGESACHHTVEAAWWLGTAAKPRRQLKRS